MCDMLDVGIRVMITCVMIGVGMVLMAACIRLTQSIWKELRNSF